jgi:hypothetical protein
VYLLPLPSQIVVQFEALFSHSQISQAYEIYVSVASQGPWSIFAHPPTALEISTCHVKLALLLSHKLEARHESFPRFSQ